MATDKNIRIITVGLNEIEKQIKQKELSLKKSELELNEYYLKDDTEGKIPQDFYNEQDKLKSEIKDLENKKVKVQRFLDVLKASRDKIIADGKYAEVNKKDWEERQTESEPKPETEKVEEKQTGSEPKPEARKVEEKQTGSEPNPKTRKVEEKQTGSEPNPKTGNVEEQLKNDQEIRREKSKKLNIQMPEFFHTIEINANTQTIKLIYDQEKNNREIPIQEVLNSKNNMYKRLDIKEQISKYCENEGAGFFKKMSLARKIDPTVVAAIGYYGSDNDFVYYLDCLYKGEKLPFNIAYNLKDSKLDKSSFNMLNKYAKRDREFDGITAEGVKENFVKRIINGMKNGKMLKTSEKPKQIASRGIESVRDTKNRVTSKLIDNIKVPGNVKGALNEHNSHTGEKNKEVNDKER